MSLGVPEEPESQQRASNTEGPEGEDLMDCGRHGFQGPVPRGHWEQCKGRG